MPVEVAGTAEVPAAEAFGAGTEALDAEGAVEAWGACWLSCRIGEPNELETAWLA